MRKQYGGFWKCLFGAALVTMTGCHEDAGDDTTSSTPTETPAEGTPLPTGDPTTPTPPVTATTPPDSPTPGETSPPSTPPTATPPPATPTPTTPPATPTPGSHATGCPGPDELVVSRQAIDQADPTEPGSAAALIEAVPGGCTVNLHFTEAAAYTFQGDLVFPSWTTLRIAAGARLEPISAATLTLEGGLDAGRQKIFGDTGKVTGHPRIDAAFPEWFGAVPDDDQDDHEGLQRAVDFFPTVLLQPGVYDVMQTVALPGACRLRGPTVTPPAAPTATLRSALVYPTSEGFHPTRVLEALPGATDLEISDLVLDGNRHSKQVDCWNYPESDNLARFEGVIGLHLDRCLITGYEANWGTVDQTLTFVLAVIDARDVVLTDVSFTDSRVEGLLFKDSSNVSIERLSTRNTDVWTPLNAFHVEDFTLTDSIVIDDEGIEWSGSTANLTVHGALITNNHFTGGWGLDFGDEGATEPYGPRDITIEQNSLETVGAGLYFSGLAPGDVVSHVMIRDNSLTLHRAESENATDEMIRFDGARDVVIEDNTFFVPDTGSGFSRGMSFAAATDTVTIRGNTLTGVDSGVSFTGDDPHEGAVNVSGNSITCTPIIRRDSWSAGSTAVYLFRYKVGHFDTLLVEDNDITAYGGWVSLIDYTSLYSTPAPFMDYLGVTGNTFLPEAGSERNVAQSGATLMLVTENTPAWVNR